MRRLMPTVYLDDEMRLAFRHAGDPAARWYDTLCVRTELERAQSLYTQGRWADALAAFRRAGDAASLDHEALDRLVWCAALLGNDDEFLQLLERLHLRCVDSDQPQLAARAAFWIGFHLLSLNEPARAMGWLRRSERHLEALGDTDNAERGYLLLPSVYKNLEEANLSAASRTAHEAAAIGERCGDHDLVALARNLEGRSLLRRGQIEPGRALLDEVMLSATRGELSPIVTGIVYCNVIATCQQMQLLDRAREWTIRLAEWCNEQPQLVTFTGYCLVHRAEVMELAGAWREADEEVTQVCDSTCKGDPEVRGEAWYRRAELLRLRARFDAAEEAYRTASEKGREPMPGLALLRLAQGRTANAVGAIVRLLAGTKTEWERAKILPAYVEIMLTAGDIDRARDGARELEAIAEKFPTEILAAMAAHARGSTALADGDPAAAVDPLRHAFGVWNRTGAPYIAARIRVLLARAYRLLGDTDGAALELEAAQRVFEKLGAALDLQSLSPTDPATPAPVTSGLSPRELEVLTLVAAGDTNRGIAQQLHISERTVERHVSNILTKLDAPSRSAATAFAYKNGLI